MIAIKANGTNKIELQIKAIEKKITYIKLIMHSIKKLAIFLIFIFLFKKKITNHKNTVDKYATKYNMTIILRYLK